VTYTPATGFSGTDSFTFTASDGAARCGTMTTMHGEVATLTAREFELLAFLAGCPRQVFRRDELLERVWGYGYFGDGRLVDVHVRRLRTKIEADPANPRHVATVRGLGYKLLS